MALPKRKHSKARGRKRRTHWKAAKMNIVDCPQCKQPKLSHRVCSYCGYYGNRQAVEIKIKKKEKKPKI